MLQMNFNPFPVLETERLILRQLKLSDAETIYEHRLKDRVNLYLENFQHASVDVTRDFITRVNGEIEKNNTILWVLTEKGNDAFIGTVCLWNVSKEHSKAETGYTMEPEQFGKGYMNEALAKAIDFGFNVMKLKEIEAYTHYENAPSIKLLVRNGFKQTSILKEDAGPDRLVFTLTSPQ